jgi:hypothetical protein
MRVTTIPTLHKGGNWEGTYMWRENIEPNNINETKVFGVMLIKMRTYF